MAGVKPAIAAANRYRGDRGVTADGTRPVVKRFHCARVVKKKILMDRRDQEFLSKQLRHMPASPRRDGTLALAMAGVFIAGMTAGALMSDYKAPATPTAEHTRTAMSMSAPSTVPIAR